jgi:ABC-type phosphate/phosphonate transport system substrate-binding protein
MPSLICPHGAWRWAVLLTLFWAAVDRVPLLHAAMAEDSQSVAGRTDATGRPLRIGAVAYAPSVVTVFENLRRYFGRNGLTCDYTLYSNYDSLVESLKDGHVDIAWNTPLAHARYQQTCGRTGQTLVMRDVDCGFRCKLIVRKDAGIASLADLHGKILVLGSYGAAEATVLPIHFLKGEGIDFENLKLLSLDREVDLRGNPCSSELYVLKALQEGRGQAGVIGERLWQQVTAENPKALAAVQDIWTSPPFSHCVFTARNDLEPGISQRFTKLMLDMKTDDPLAGELMRLEGTKKWVAGSPDGFETLIEALSQEGSR